MSTLVSRNSTAGDYDAIVLAAAGLERLGIADRVSVRQFRSRKKCCPPRRRGSSESNVADDKAELRELTREYCNHRVNHHSQRLRQTAAERAVAATLQASCQSPVATLTHSLFRQRSCRSKRFRGVARRQRIAARFAINWIGD